MLAERGERASLLLRSSEIRLTKQLRPLQFLFVDRKNTEFENLLPWSNKFSTPPEGRDNDEQWKEEEKKKEINPYFIDGKWVIFELLNYSR